MAGARVKLVFLDACRDNPFTNKIRAAARTRSVTILSGLAEMKPNEGTLIAFAAGPGQTALDGKPGENSPFTRALLSHVAEPGVEIRQALTEVRAQVSRETNKGQLPSENTNLTGFFYVNQQGTTAGTTARIGALGAAAVPFEARSNAWNEVELEFWRSVRSSDKTALPTRETEQQLALDQLKGSDIQRRLGTLGYFDGAADGNFNDNTRRAIERWQTARRYLRSGYFNTLQYEALLAERLPFIRSAAPAIPRQQPAAQPQPFPARSAATATTPALSATGCKTWRLPPSTWLWARQPLFVGQRVQMILPDIRTRPFP
jgi:hypothetical protein